MSHIYLAKDNEDLCCHCSCDVAYITFPPQMDCPWCGCGWLFTCMECRKAFTFARAVEVNESWQELARRDVEGKWKQEADDEIITAWIEAMQELLADVQEGKQYVCLDGLFIPTDVEGLDYAGWHSEHHLDFVPQVQALQDDSIVDELLANPEYWREHAIEDDD